MYTLRNRATGELIAERIAAPRGWYQRTLGLLNRSSLEPGEGLWLDRCWGIHTVGMRFSIDVVFLDTDFRILSLRRDVSPGCLAVVQANATNVIELRAGTCEQFDLLSGDRMALTDLTLSEMRHH